MSGCGSLPHAWAAGHGVYLGVWGRGWRLLAGNCFAKIDTVTVCENSEKKKMAGKPEMCGCWMFLRPQGILLQDPSCVFVSFSQSSRL